MQLIECVPNFSEGSDSTVIQQIAAAIESVAVVQLLDIDPGKAANRTVMTFVGPPEAVVEAAFLAIKTAAELIDMSTQKGTHPRLGATDVCPLIPIANISVEELLPYAEQLGERVGNELQIPVYLYEHSATRPERKNLATIRSGEYEGLSKKLEDPKWTPDYGPTEINAKAGATVLGVRDFLIAYNINLSSTSVPIANAIAYDVRERGRLLKEGDAILRDASGKALRIPGACKYVKAIGWFIEEYGIAQVSMNLTNFRATPIHIAFEAVQKSARTRGVAITGSELIGMIPLEALLEAGTYFMAKEEGTESFSELELIEKAVKTLGLDDLRPFDPYKKIIEYRMKNA